MAAWGHRVLQQPLRALEAGLREPVLPGKEEAASLRDQNVLGPLLLCVLIIISGEELISK